jgi:hypothetical protein
MRFLDDVPRVGRLANERHGKRVDHALVSLDQAAERIVPTRDIVGRSGGGHQVGVGRWKCAVGGVDGVSHRSDSREGWSECQNRSRVNAHTHQVDCRPKNAARTGGH